MDLFGDLPNPGDKPAEKIRSSVEVSIQSKVTVDERAGECLGGEKRKPAAGVESDEPPVKKVQEQGRLYMLCSFVTGRKGERDEMQDAHVLKDNFSIPDTHISLERLAYYAVFDGHAGLRASQYAAANLHTVLSSKFPKGNVASVEKEIKKCFVDTFKKVDEDFLKEAAKHKPTWKDGTTAVVVLVVNNTLFIANLGDSKAILCREKDNACVGVALSKDHSPTVYEERMRIQRAGGYVREGRMMGQLEVSRSLGDGSYKKHGVSCIPDIKRCQLTDKDRYILMACDGLWKAFSTDEALTYINDILEAPSSNDISRETRFETACGKIASEAVRRGSGDNVTVVFISLS